MPRLALLLIATALVGLAATFAPLAHGQEQDAPGEPAKTPAQIMLEQARPGPEHERLAALVGAWTVEQRAGGRTAAKAAGGAGTATVASILDDRFFDVGITIGKDDAAQRLRFTLGFDRRHDEFTITLIDTAGTYAVSARGKEADGLIRMHGTDDDPYMASLGLEKAFAFDLVLGDGTFEIVLHFVDTRTPERPLMEATRYVFRR